MSASKRVRDASSTGEIIVTNDLLAMGEQAEKAYQNYQKATQFAESAAANSKQRLEEIRRENPTDPEDLIRTKHRRSQHFKEDQITKREWLKVKNTYDKAQNALERAVKEHELQQQKEKEKEKEPEFTPQVIGELDNNDFLDTAPMY